jgi:hypothetical protein
VAAAGNAGHAHSHGHSGGGHNHSHDHGSGSGHGGGSGHGSAVSHPHGPSRNLAAIKSLVKSAPGLAGCRKWAVRAFELLAEAEAHAHGCALDQVRDGAAVV